MSTINAGPRYLLDTLAGQNAAAAYSLRRLRSSYTGASIRVRRSSDNAEQDIGFDVNGNLDTAALTTFVGANSGFVTTWYDQSGNARNATQATATNQPRIVNVGTIDRANGKVALVYDGTNDRFETTITSIDLSSGDNVSGFTVVRPTTMNTWSVIVSKFNGIDGQGAASEDGWEFRLSNTSRANMVYCKDAVYTNFTSTTSEIVNIQRLFSFFANGGSLTTNTNIFANGAELSTTLSGALNTLDDTNYVINIGAALFQNVYYYHWPGSMQEIVLYNSNNRSNRTSIENNINNYYRIY